MCINLMVNWSFKFFFTASFEMKFSKVFLLMQIEQLIFYLWALALILWPRLLWYRIKTEWYYQGKIRALMDTCTHYCQTLICLYKIDEACNISVEESNIFHKHQYVLTVNLKTSSITHGVRQEICGEVHSIWISIFRSMNAKESNEILKRVSGKPSLNRCLVTNSTKKPLKFS